MKIALIIKDGFEQIVLTPESDTEDKILDLMRLQDREISIHRGHFEQANRGYYRMYSGLNARELNSVIVCFRPVPKTYAEGYAEGPAAKMEDVSQ